jgi:hypothetical protein
MQKEQKPVITRGTIAQIGNLHVQVFSIEHDHVLINVNGRLESFSFEDVENLFVV